MLRFTLALLLASLTACAIAATGPYDLVFRNVRIGDGTGTTWFRGDLAIRGDSIMEGAEDVVRAMAHPVTMIASAGVLETKLLVLASVSSRDTF